MAKNISISILSGKGGVGKTNIALNLAYCLSELGQKVIIMDCDIGLANIDVLLGLNPGKNLQHILFNEEDPQEVVMPIEENLHLIAATSGVPEILDLEEDVQFLIEEKLQNLLKEYDFIILDLGAGIGTSTLSFAASSPLRIIIITPEPTSLTDSYAVIKILKNNYKVKNFLILVNSVSSEQEASLAFQRLNTACKNFLGVSLFYLGYVHYDESVVRAVREQTPFLKRFPENKASLDIKNIGKKILKLTENPDSIKRGFSLIKGKNKPK